MKFDDLGERALPQQPMPDAFEYDVFVDLSASSMSEAQIAQHVRQLRREGGYDSMSTDISVALPGRTGIVTQDADLAHASSEGPQTFVRSAQHAAKRRRHLLVILGTLVPSNEAIASLLPVLASDPLFGSAQPRLADPLTDTLWPLFEVPKAKRKLVMTSREVLMRLPAVVVAAETLGPCMLIRRELLAGIGESIGYESARGAVLHALCMARRKGFRTAISQRTVVPVSADDAAGAVAPGRDTARLVQKHPDHARATQENELQRVKRLEALLSAAFPRNGEPRRLLMDCRGMGAMHNGTSQCVLGILDGLAQINDPRWKIEVWSSAIAAAFHELPRRFPGFRHVHGPLQDSYAALLVPNQPWALGTVLEHHGLALALVFNMLDTIAWDVIYPSDDRVEPCWRYISKHADGLAYISAYTRDRFRVRFPVAPQVEERVVHLSLSKSEYEMPRIAGTPPEDHILVFGNSYDHKDLAPTLEVLGEAFPLQEFVVLGGASKSTRVRVIPSGRTSNEEIHKLIATARAIVYPSYYEGFGLPVLESLAYGRPVLVRKSPLWSEIAANVRLPGQLIEFDDPLSLIEMVGRVLGGQPVPVLAQAGNIQPGTEHGWKECAAGLLELARAALEKSDVERWLERDLTLGMVRP